MAITPALKKIKLKGGNTEESSKIMIESSYLLAEKNKQPHSVKSTKSYLQPDLIQKNH